MSMQHVGEGVYLVEIVHLLSDLYNAEQAAAWLRTPQPLLDNARPVDCFGSDEAEKKMCDILKQMRDSTFL
jgi:uncharacterized protein (DUF2384 family)